MSAASGHHAGVATGLEMAAGIAALCGRGNDAARLVGAAQAIRDAMGCARVPAQEIDNEEIFRIARSELGDEGFEPAWKEGLAMSTTEAVAFALQPPP